MRYLFAKGRIGALLCRYCQKDLDGGDALEHFKQEAKQREISELWACNEAKNYGWSEETKVRWVQYYTPYEDGTKFTLQNGDEYMTDQICPQCKGIFPLDPTEKREFYLHYRISPFRNGGNIVESGATFSPDEKYRYELHRIWDNELDKIMFILLNPSTANTDTDDHTTKRCIDFAKRFKYGGMYIVNLFAYKSTDPRKLKEIDESEDPIGPDNKKYIEECLGKVSKVVYAWGEKIKFVSPFIEPPWIKELVAEPYCFKKTKDGYPYHPRSIETTCSLVPFREEVEEPAPPPPLTQEERERAYRRRLEALPPLPPSPSLNAIVMPPSCEHLKDIPKSTYPECTIEINKSILKEFKFPEGKTMKDLIELLYSFFEPK